MIFRDVEHLLTTILVPWFILTPIFYTFDLLPGFEDNETARERPLLRERHGADGRGDP